MNAIVNFIGQITEEDGEAGIAATRMPRVQKRENKSSALWLNEDSTLLQLQPTMLQSHLSRSLPRLLDNGKVGDSIDSKTCGLRCSTVQVWFSL